MSDKQINSEAHLTLSADHTPLLKDVKVGGKVRLVMYGTLKSVSQNSGEATDEGGAQSGSLSMSVTGLKIASNNDIAELFDEEFDE